MDTHINSTSTEPNFEILKDSFEMPHLQMMFTKEQVTQILLKFGLENKVSLRNVLEYINTNL